MRYNRIGYYISEGINSIFTHGFMSFASVCIIVACLIMMGSFALIAVNVEEIIQSMENENEILAFVDENLSDEAARALEGEIEAIPNVANAIFVDRDEAWESFKDSYPNQSLFLMLTSDVLRHRYVVYLNDISLMAETQQDLLQIYGIATVNVQLEISEGFIRLEQVITTISIIIVLILFIISLFIMANTIKLTTFDRKDEIAIMKMVGATSTFIRWPFIVEGLILGVFGSLIAYILQWAIYRGFISLLMSSGFAFITTVSFSLIAVPLLVIFLVIGIFVGVIGSLIAIRNYLKV